MSSDESNKPFTNTVDVEDEPAPVPEPDLADARFCRNQFVLFSICFGVNHATVTTPIVYASSVLGNTLGQSTDATLYGLCLITSLFFATWIQSLIGSKKGLLFSMFAYAFYVLFFGIAVSLCNEFDEKGNCMQKGTDSMWAFGIVGSFVGGIGAGVLWTCQGIIFSNISSRVATAEVRPLTAATAELSGVFAFWFLLMECLARFFSSLALRQLHFSKAALFYLFAGVAFLVTLIYMALGQEMETGPRARGSFFGKVLMAIKQWSDPKTWLLQFTNITFGFVAAYLGGYINRNITSKMLSPSFLGYASSLLSLIASLMSRVFGPLSRCVGKGPVMCVGAIAFFLIGVFSRWAHVHKWPPSATIIFYVLMGIGRAVYESTNKGIFADFFPGDKSPGAFANVFVFGTGASTLTFILGALSEKSGGGETTGDDVPTTIEFYLVIVSALLTVPGFVAASLLRMSQERTASLTAAP